MEHILALIILGVLLLFVGFEWRLLLLAFAGFLLEILLNTATYLCIPLQFHQHVAQIGQLQFLAIALLVQPRGRVSARPVRFVGALLTYFNKLLI